MAIPKNRKVVMAILAEISPRIIGKPHAGFTCNCGAVHADPGVATEIEPGGDSYPGQETCHSMWSVHIQSHPGEPGDPGGFHVCLSEFIPFEELDAIFLKHFGPNPSEDNPYGLFIEGSDRVKNNLGAAVRIQENDHQIRFCFDWGRDQKYARALDKIQDKQTSSRIPSGSKTFSKILGLLVTLSPIVYLGGPEPELPFESKWRTDYAASLFDASHAKHIFFQNCGSAHYGEGEKFTETDVVFSKIPIK